MNLHEYQAKDLLRKYNLPILEGKSYIENVYDLDWDGIDKKKGGKTYGDIFLQQEKEFSKYNWK